MKFKTTDHKNLVQDLINNSNFPGAILELALELKYAVERSEIDEAMKFDRPEHKQLLQEMLKVSSFSGAILELVMDLKVTVNESTDF